MLGNCETIMTPISSATNQWPQQNQILDDHKSLMASSSPNKVMEKTNQDHHPLKCPRCDSCNTKFCYYNNYSLSQPRHFCKACKRYWTRGGTLRNVPVGGGCRKNKKLKARPQSSAAAASTATTNPSHVIDLPSASNHINNPLFYNPLELNFPFSSYSNSTRVSSGFDQMNNGLGIGFPSGLVMATDHQVPNNNYKNGFRELIQDGISITSNASPFSTAAGNNSIFFGSSTSTMASLLASTLQQQKFGKNIQANNFVPGYEDTQMLGGNGALMGKEVKHEGESRLAWNNPNPIEQINSSDPSSLLWNTTSVGAWFDPSNMGSSVPSLI